MSSLSVLYERPISQSLVAEWRRNRERYEREVKRYAPKPVVIVRRVAIIPKTRTRWVTLCQCGCGQQTVDPRTLWVSGHRIVLGDRPKSAKEIDEQISRIPDTELGRLCKKVLLRELGRE